MKHLTLALLMSVALVACSKKEDTPSVETPSAPGGGSGMIENKLFEFSVSKPAGWHVQSTEEMIKLSQKGSSLMAGNDQNMKVLLEESLKTTLPLFGFFQHPPGTPVPTNASLMGVAENVSQAPGIKKGCDYIFHARKLIEGAALKYTVSPGCQTLTQNGITFGYMDASVTANGVDVKQRYLACVSGNHVLSFVQTYFDEKSKQEVEAAFATVKAKCV